jgi:hypothetical protein
MFDWDFLVLCGLVVLLTGLAGVCLVAMGVAVARGIARLMTDADPERLIPDGEERGCYRTHAFHGCVACGGRDFVIIQTPAGSGDHCVSCGRVRGY